jgi:Fanconi anemia group M protein
MKAPTVIADLRERNEELLEALADRGVDVERTTLNVGDFVLSDRVCVERKTVSDFESSIIDGRLFDQMRRIREHYSFPLLIVEGHRADSRLGSTIMNGAIASLYIDHGIVALAVPDARGTAETMACIAKKEQSGEVREPSAKGGARAYTMGQLQTRIIGNLPGVGPKIARALLEHFGSVKAVSNASKEELMKVEKIGKKKAERIHAAINSDYRSGT